MSLKAKERIKERKREGTLFTLLKERVRVRVRKHGSMGVLRREKVEKKERSVTGKGEVLREGWTVRCGV